MNWSPRSYAERQGENEKLLARIAELEAELHLARTASKGDPLPVHAVDPEVTLIHHLMDDAPVGFAFFDTSFRFRMVNKKLAQMNGALASEHVGRTPQEMAPQVASQARRAFEEVLVTRKPLLDVEFSGESSGEPGLMRHWSESWYPVHGVDGRFLGVGAVVTEITEHKRALEAAGMNQQRLDLAQAAARVGSWDFDPRTKITHCSQGYGPLYGFPPSTLGPSSEEWLNRVHPDDRNRMRDLIDRTLAGEDEYRSEFRVVWPDHSVHWLLGRGRVLRDLEGKATRVLGVNMDISALKQAEQAAKESEQRFRKLADGAPVLICVAGPDSQTTFFNQGWLSFTGRTMEQEVGDGWIANVHPEDREALLSAIGKSFEKRSYCHAEYRLRRADGEYRWLLCSGAPNFQPDGRFAGFVASAIDITDLKLAHEVALGRQRLESVGVLAGGIAHDFNNLLGSIVAESELLEEDQALDAKTVESVSRIRKIASLAAGIVQELLAYTAKEETTFHPVDASALVREMLELLKVSISKGAILQIDLSPNLPAVNANASQIWQVVLNLVTNASDALGEHRGIIKLATSPERLTPERAAAQGLALPEGDYVRLEVSDNGAGMTEQVRARIFDPFFSTKFSGRGLGLAVVQKIIQSHHGAIQVSSTPGQGARFEILLPAAAELPVEAGEFIGHKIDSHLGARAGTVLLVEDESSLRLPISKMLKKRGYTVIEADNGLAAIEAFRNSPREIAAVVLDMTLPGISGAAVFHELRSLQPQVKVILTTAYSREKTLTDLGELNVWAFLRKPYKFADLVSLLQRATSAVASV